MYWILRCELSFLTSESITLLPICACHTLTNIVAKCQLVPANANVLWRHIKSSSVHAQCQVRV